MAKRLEVPKGTRFSRLTVVKEVECNTDHRRQFLCRCDCGNEKVILLADLRSGHSKSCGCRCSTQRKINIDDYIGKRYGTLVVIGEGEHKQGGRYKVRCRCDCGSVKDYSLNNLENGTKNCGCMRNVHDGVKARCKEHLYRTYKNMKARCNNPNLPNYYNYGGRGIRVCEEWENSYGAFRSWAYSHGYSPELTLDRIDNNGNYEPGNCRWVDMKVQSNNKRTNVRVTYNNETHTLAEWSEITGISYAKLQVRTSNGCTAEEIFR